MKEYENGIYSVAIQNEKGAISVKKGDWVSKYSAAIYNDFTRLFEFGRMEGTAMPVVIKDPDKIYAGETIYHLGDYYKSKKDSIPNAKDIKLTHQQKKKLIIRTLQADYNLKGQNLKIIDSALNILGKTSDALSIAEATTLLTEGSMLAGVASGIGFASTMLFPVGGVIMLQNANETRERLYGLRGIAYTITAWAFDKPIPKGSPKYIGFSKGLSARDLNRLHKAWKDVSLYTIKWLQNEARGKKVQEKSLKLLYRALADDGPRKLCLKIRKGMENKLDHIGKIFWKSEVKTLYPE
jgi:hypothetical protein